MTRRSLPLREIRAEAEFFEQSIRQLDAKALTDEVSAFRPGGTMNPEKDAKGWYVWLRRLIGLHGRLFGAGPSSRESQADVIALDTLTGEPVTVASPITGDDGAPRTFTIYPKSWQTLVYLVGCEQHFRRLQPTTTALLKHPDYNPEVMERVLAALSDLLQRFVWIITTPGPGMPMPKDELHRADVPPAIVALHPVDLHAIIAANAKTQVRLAAVRDLMLPDQDSPMEQLHWSPFWANAAEVLGVQSKVLMRDWELEAVLTQMRLMGDNRRRAEAEADARRERDNP